jgi:hypothetical protein
MSETPSKNEPERPNPRPVEMEAVRTTIVGGRPPGSGRTWGAIPRGVEVLVKKAAIDPEFRALLLAQRAEAANAIGLVLDPAEVAMLNTVPAAQLEAIIDRTTVPVESRAAFLGRAAAVMLAALGADTACKVTGSRPDRPPAPTGAAPDRPPSAAPDRPPSAAPPPSPSPTPQPTPQPTPSPTPGPVRGIRPEKTPDVRPDRPPAPTGIAPDRPPTAGGARPDIP